MERPKSKAVWGYVSDDVISMESQSKAITAFCNERFMKLDHIFADDLLVPGVENNCPNFNNMMRLLRCGDCIIITTIERLGSDFVDLQLVQSKIKELGCVLIILDNIGRSHHSVDDLMSNISGINSRHDRIEFIGKIRIAIEQQGPLYDRPDFGYQYDDVTNPSCGKSVPNIQEQIIINRISLMIDQQTRDIINRCAVVIYNDLIANNPINDATIDS
jgi:DNA invertase Pin-like site-specific DNA recombinase